jgi:nitrate reductase NapAB chaperone NapD
MCWVVEALAPEVSVHQYDEQQGKIVVVQEAPDVNAEVEGLEADQGAASRHV